MESVSLGFVRLYGMVLAIDLRIPHCYCTLYVDDGDKHQCDRTRAKVAERERISHEYHDRSETKTIQKVD